MVSKKIYGNLHFYQQYVTRTVSLSAIDKGINSLTYLPICYV